MNENEKRYSWEIEEERKAGEAWSRRERDPAYRIPCDGNCADNDPLLGAPGCPGWRIDFERIQREVYDENGFLRD